MSAASVAEVVLPLPPPLLLTLLLLLETISKMCSLEPVDPASITMRNGDVELEVVCELSAFEFPEDDATSGR